VNLYLYLVLAFVLVCCGAAFARALFSQSFLRRKNQLDEQERRLLELFNQIELQAGEVRKETADQLSTLKRLSELLETVKEGQPLQPAYRRESEPKKQVFIDDELDNFPTFDGEFPFDEVAPATGSKAVRYAEDDFDEPRAKAEPPRRIISEDFDFDSEEASEPKREQHRRSSYNDAPWGEDDIDDGF
jgi:hypothetical protein